MREETGFLDRGDGQQVAWRRVAGRGPTVVWLGGFMSDMAGTKAQALADWAETGGRAFLTTVSILITGFIALFATWLGIPQRYLGL